MKYPRSEELAYWINERERMRQRKEAGIPVMSMYGWSKDPHMGTVRYCNVRREDDKVTRWLAERWRPRHHAVWQILLARLINNIPTLERLLPAVSIGDLEAVRNQLTVRRSRGETIFGSAYTVSTNGRSMDKVDYIIDCVLAPAKDKNIDGFWDLVSYPGTLAQAAEDLVVSLHGVSSFMAGQIIADLKNTQGHHLCDAPDWWTWAAPGPGSMRGLAAFYGRPITPSKFYRALVECHKLVNPLLDPSIGRLHMQDFQNCMCEFSKYVRVKEGGHARNRYRAGDH